MGGGKKSAPAPAAPAPTQVIAAPTPPIERKTNPNALERTDAAANPSLLATEDENKRLQSSMLG